METAGTEKRDDLTSSPTAVSSSAQFQEAASVQSSGSGSEPSPGASTGDGDDRDAQRRKDESGGQSPQETDDLLPDEMKPDGGATTGAGEGRKSRGVSRNTPLCVCGEPIPFNAPRRFFRHVHWCSRRRQRLALLGAQQDGTAAPVDLEGEGPIHGPPDARGDALFAALAQRHVMHEAFGPHDYEMMASGEGVLQFNRRHRWPIVAPFSVHLAEQRARTSQIGAKRQRPVQVHEAGVPTSSPMIVADTEQTLPSGLHVRGGSADGITIDVDTAVVERARKPATPPKEATRVSTTLRWQSVDDCPRVARPRFEFYADDLLPSA